MEICPGTGTILTVQESKILFLQKLEFVFFLSAFYQGIDSNIIGIIKIVVY